MIDKDFKKSLVLKKIPKNVYLFILQEQGKKKQRIGQVSLETTIYHLLTELQKMKSGKV